MSDVLKLVIAVIIGNLCTVGVAVLAIDPGLHTRLFDLPGVQDEAAASAVPVGTDSNKPERPRYKARVPIPGHPIGYCLGPDRELNKTVHECTRMKVMTVYDDEPIPNPVARLRDSLRDVCEGEQGASMTAEQHQEWCDMHTRVQLYGDSIRIQPAARIN